MTYYYVKGATEVFVYRTCRIFVISLECVCVCATNNRKSFTGICLTNDVDTLLYHMNNARYLREIDFARVDFYERTKLYKTILSKGGSVVQGATTIRYRRFIRPFTLFQITSKIIYWDDQFIYMEHRFVSPVDGFIHCIAICRQRLINVVADEVINCLLLTQQNSFIKSGLGKVENGDLIQGKPEVPIDVKLAT